eukprot:COSAG03_NODE_2217_length_2995_cov_2.175414_5_plen_343_part_00
MGGAVAGGTILGRYPDQLREAVGSLNIGRGRIIPTTPWEAVWHGVAQWLGVVPSGLSTVLPNKERWLTFDRSGAGRRHRRQTQDGTGGDGYLFTCDEMYEECPDPPADCEVGVVVAPANGRFGQICAGAQGSVTIEHGASCDLACDEGFELSDQPTCIEGTLSSTTAICTAQTCDLSVLQAPVDGAFGAAVCTEAAGTIEHGASCDLTCDDGFELSDQPTCIEGTLSSTTASCTWVSTAYLPAQCAFSLMAEQLAAFHRGDTSDPIQAVCRAYFLNMMSSHGRPAFVLKAQCSAEMQCNLASLVHASNDPTLLATAELQAAATSCVAVLTALAGGGVCEHLP